MQEPLIQDLFPDAMAPSAGREASDGTAARRSRGGVKVRAQAPAPDHVDWSTRLPALLRLGTSSWTYPGWKGLVWDGDYADPLLAKHGLAAYTQHPLMRCVSLDRAFYRALTRAQYAAYAAQVPDGFRFVVKAPSSVADALVRDESGRALQPNPLFLDAALAVREFAEPALEGLGSKLGALVFQLSPMSPALLADLPAVLQRLRTLLRALPSLRPDAPDAVVAVQVRDPEFLTPALVEVLRESGATYCLGLHPKMPAIDGQLPLLRALWPGPLVCRWNMHLKHGPYGYEEARRVYAPYDRLADPDPSTRAVLARVALATAAAGYPAYVTIGNKAEGCAPLSVAELARVLVGRGA